MKDKILSRDECEDISYQTIFFDKLDVSFLHLCWTFSIEQSFIDKHNSFNLRYVLWSVVSRLQEQTFSTEEKEKMDFSWTPSKTKENKHRNWDIQKGLEIWAKEIIQSIKPFQYSFQRISHSIDWVEIAN